MGAHLKRRPLLTGSSIALAFSIAALLAVFLGNNTPCVEAQAGSCSQGDIGAFEQAIMVDEAATPSVLATAAASRSGDQIAAYAPAIGGDIVAEWLPSTFIQKSADEIVSASTALQNDDDFFWTALANETYQVVGWWNITTSASGGLSLQAVVPSGSAECGTTGAIGGQQFTHSTPAINGTSNDGLVLIQCEFLIGVTGGSTGFQWAQGAATGTTTLESSSAIMRVTTQ